MSADEPEWELAGYDGLGKGRIGIYWGSIVLRRLQPVRPFPLLYEDVIGQGLWPLTCPKCV
jgi:hypothetical protein